MCNDTAEWWKIWRGNDLLFQNWRKKFDGFWLEHWKGSKFYTLIGCFWPKYIMLELKKYRRVMFDGTEYWCNIWRKTDLYFQTWLEEFSIFSPDHVRKFKKLGLLLGPFIQSRKCMSFKFTGELCFMTMKNDAKFVEELTCQFKIDMRNLTNFDLSTRKSQKSAL